MLAAAPRSPRDRGRRRLVQAEAQLAARLVLAPARAVGKEDARGVWGLRPQADERRPDDVEEQRSARVVAHDRRPLGMRRVEQVARRVARLQQVRRDERRVDGGLDQEAQQVLDEVLALALPEAVAFLGHLPSSVVLVQYQVLDDRFHLVDALVARPKIVLSVLRRAAHKPGHRLVRNERRRLHALERVLLLLPHLRDRVLVAVEGPLDTIDGEAEVPPLQGVDRVCVQPNARGGAGVALQPPPPSDAPEPGTATLERVAIAVPAVCRRCVHAAFQALTILRPPLLARDRLRLGRRPLRRRRHRVHSHLGPAK